MERTPVNVKDKYKELGGDNNNLISKDIALIRILKLLKAIGIIQQMIKKKIIKNVIF